MTDISCLLRYILTEKDIDILITGYIHGVWEAFYEIFMVYAIIGDLMCFDMQ